MIARHDRDLADLNLDIFWLKDDALEESANLPAPDLIAQEITNDLEGRWTSLRRLRKI
jgi:type I restriction enzyme M protein